MCDSWHVSACCFKRMFVRNCNSASGAKAMFNCLSVVTVISLSESHDKADGLPNDYIRRRQSTKT